MLIHFYFNFVSMKIQYEIFYIFLRRGRMHANKVFFFIYIFFATFRRKSNILIPNLYFYNIKTQTSINKKIDRKIHEKTINIFKRGIK